jgi:hypothetical protein
LRYFLFYLLQSNLLPSPNQGQIYCAPELRPTLAKIRELPEASALIEQVLEEGNLRIQWNKSLTKKFEGYWSASNRTIYLTKSNNQANLISTLLFELHNALSNERFENWNDLAYCRQISKRQYVREIEFMEYENAKSTKALLDKGIRQKLFPSSARWYLHDTFEEHFRLQKQTGHSAFIGRAYDQIAA